MPQLQQAKPQSRLARFNEITQVLLRNDFYGLVRELARGGPQPAPTEGPSSAVRMRRILEELGPTFIKIGQLLATRPDLVPRSYVEEFRKLYDQTTPSPYEEVRRTIREELGRDVEEVFAEFSPTPLASASIGQVHKARLKDGTPVAVKVQHHGIEEAMRVDFEIMEGIVRFIERTFAASRVWQPQEHLHELRVMLERELDYTVEMRNTVRVAENFRGDPSVKLPTMYEALCSRRIITMEFVEGIKFTDLKDPRLAAIDLPSVARVVTHAMARQIFIHRLFHADPSPGNLLILASDRVAFLDFGAVGIVTERRARTILRLITSIARGDAEGATESVLELCDQKAEVDLKRLRIDMERILDFFEREEVSVADPRLMELILGIAKQHQMLLPPDFVLISRALFQFEGFCRVLDPAFNLVPVLEPLVGEVAWKNMAGSKHHKEFVEETVIELVRFLRGLPHTLNTVLRKLERNEIGTRVELVGLEGIKRSHGRGVLKTSFTVMMAALLIGLGIVYAGPVPEERVGPFLFASGAVLFVWTAVMILWSEAFKGNRE
ncbi:MAG TPA: AarF/ABC1/UbiB kinase family protein [Candidatus Thermoplasmatota archaeon]|nr:AarF/ABC1/UbiB kinase family protein [Candidatus Thermoplasmatota archaeon]